MTHKLLQLGHNVQNRRRAVGGSTTGSWAELSWVVSLCTPLRRNSTQLNSTSSELSCVAINGALVTACSVTCVSLNWQFITAAAVTATTNYYYYSTVNPAFTASRLYSRLTRTPTLAFLWVLSEDVSSPLLPPPLPDTATPFGFCYNIIQKCIQYTSLTTAHFIYSTSTLHQHPV